MSRHCSSYGAYLNSSRLSRTHCVKTPSTTASVDCDQASHIDGSVFRIFCGFHSYNTTVQFSHCISQMILLPRRQILLTWEGGEFVPFGHEDCMVRNWKLHWNVSTVLSGVVAFPFFVYMLDSIQHSVKKHATWYKMLGIWCHFKISCSLRTVIYKFFQKGYVRGFPSYRLP